MKNRATIVEEGYAILPGAKGKGALVIGKGLVKPDVAKDKPAVPYDQTGLPFSIWGDDNLFPQNVLTDLGKSHVASKAIEKRQTIHFGRGIIAYRNMKDATGVMNQEVVNDQEIMDFFEINTINFQWPKLILGLETLYNAWIEVILNKGRDRINRFYVKDSAYCRMAKMDPVTRKIPYLYYSAQWEMAPDAESEVVEKIPMWDPSKLDPVTGVYPDGKFAIQLTYQTLNTTFYSLAPWNAVRVNKWMDIAAKVPALKYAIMKNQMTIKYHVQIPDFYFDNKYPSPDYTKEQRTKGIQETLDELNDFLSDVENSGKSFVSMLTWDKIEKKLKDGWKIEVIDNKLVDGAYLPDTQAANSEILFGMGVDPCLIGSSGVPGGGGKLGAGSGSDKREAYWMLNADMGISRQSSLWPLYFVKRFNKWDPAIQFDYVTVDTSQTQDQHPTKTEKRIDINQA
jgi:hypothetical protein